MITLREIRLMRVVQALRAGNPNHDPATGQFTSGGGAGHARRRRRRKKRREALRKDLKAQAAEIKANHRAERKQTLRDERKDRRKLATGQRREWAREVKAARKKVATGETAKERNEARARAREDLANLKADHKQQRLDQRAEHLSQRETDKAYRREEWQSFREGVKIDIREVGFKQKGVGGERSLDDVGVARKLTISPGRTHKASSAESILRHCLRQLGLTGRFRAGRLTARQGLRLLQCIREYGRAWLRHEAEAFAREYLGWKPPAARGVEWVPGPGGFLHARETGFRANVGRFFSRARQFVRELIVAGAMSILGPAPLTGEELDAAAKEATKQEQFFDRFHDEVLKNPPAPRVPPRPLVPGQVMEVPLAPPPMTPKQFAARVERYADSSWQASQRINRTAAIGHGVARRERRVLGHPRTSHCDDCPPLAARGWVPVGTLPQIGDTECGPLCLCHFVYDDGTGNQFFQGKKGPVPAPARPADMEPEDDGVHLVAEPPGGLTTPVPIAGPPRK